MPGKAQSLDNLDNKGLTMMKRSIARKAQSLDDLDNKDVTKMMISIARKGTVIRRS